MSEIQNLADNWGIVNLRDITISVKTGTTPPSKVEKYYGGDIQWFRPEDIGTEKYLTKSSRTITQEAINDKKARIFSVNTLLITCIGNIGRVGILSLPASSNQQITGIEIDETICLTEFVFWWFRFIQDSLHRSSPGGIIKILNQTNLLSVHIPIPYPDDPARSLAEQRRIVARLEALLSEVRALRDLLQSMRRDWSALMESALAEVFPHHEQALPDGWEWKTIPDVCSINPKRPRIERDDETPTSFAPMQAVDEQTGTIADVQTRPYGEVRRGYTYFEENDVLMAKITPSMENGKAAIARNLIDGIGFGTTEFHVFHPHSNILPEWIFYFIRQKTFRERAKMSFRGAVGQQRVPEDFLVNQEIPVPYPDDPARSLAEQRRIVAYLEAVQEEVSAARQQVEEDERRVTQLEQSILAAAFRGEV